MVVCINICGISGALGRFGWVKNCYIMCYITRFFIHRAWNLSLVELLIT